MRIFYSIYDFKCYVCPFRGRVTCPVSTRNQTIFIVYKGKEWMKSRWKRLNIFAEYFVLDFYCFQFPSEPRLKDLLGAPLKQSRADMQLTSTCTFLLIFGWFGEGLTLRVERGRKCVTVEGEQGMCVGPKLCPTLDKIKWRQQIRYYFENFIP